MTKFAQLFTTSGTGAYGKAESLPSFGIGEALYVLGSSFWATPTTDAWGGSAGSPSMVGTPGTTGLQVGTTNKLTFPRAGRTIFNVNNAMTYGVIAKPNAALQQLLGDYAASQPYAILTIPSGGTILRASSSDGTATVNADTTMPASIATTWTMFFGVYTLTTAQPFYYRASTGLVQGTLGTKASGAPGSTTKAPVTGETAIGGTPNSLDAVLGIWKGALTYSQMVEVGEEATRLMASIGETL